MSLQPKFFMCRIIIIQRHVCLDHTWHKRGTQLSSHNGLPRSIVIGFIFFTHFCDCPVKTELICRNNYAKNSLNCFLSGTKMNQPFSSTFAFKHSSGQSTRGSKDWVSASVTVIFSAILFHSPCGPSSLMEYHFFSDPGPRNDHCPAPIFFAKRETS